MTNVLKLALLGLAILWLASPEAHAQYCYYYSNLSDDGATVYGSAVTEDDPMYGEIHSNSTEAEIFHPQGWSIPGYGTTRADLQLAIDAGGLYRFRGIHSVYCTYYGYLLYRAVTERQISIPPPRQFTLTERAFIPAPYVTAQASCGHPLYGDAPLMYTGDNRSYDYYSSSYRNQTRIAVTPLRRTVDWTSFQAGISKAYAFFFEEDSEPGDCWKWHAGPAYGDTSNMRAYGSWVQAADMTVQISGFMRNPLAISPAIDWNYQVIINGSTYNPTYNNLVGSHDCYPAHELYIGTQRVHEYMPPSNDPWYITQCLFGFSPHQFGPRSGGIY
jgi:hypothetical protein